MKNLNHSFNTPGINRRNFLKKTSVLGAATLASTLLPWRTLAAMADGFPVVETQYGKVRGMDVAGINTFRGIRYGADTSGANRFMPPVKPKKWDGVYDAFAYGPISPQAPGDPTDPYTQSVSWDAHAKSGMSEDCLRLNIWTPSVDDNRKRPVFFYTHGGGFTSGSGGLAFDGDPLARLADGVVVTVNHRLGPLGYLDLGTLGGDSKFDKAGVAGMLDLIAALEWVHENIENFGGDPENVMIFGQSGGGAKVSTLLAMPAAKGLIHKAAIQSGASITLGSRDSSKEQAQKMIEEFDVSASKLKDLQNVPWTDIIEAEANSGFRPVVDGDVIPNHPCDPAAPEVSADLPIIVGYTREDGAIRDITDSPINEEGLQEWINETYSENASLILSTYKKVYPNATPFQIQSRIRTDARTRKNATTMAERKSALNRGNAYFYVVEWASPAYEGRFGACHGVDLGLFLANPRNLIAGNTAEARKMANIIGSAVAAFGKTGNPNCDKIPYWPAYNTDTRATMVFDTESRVENDPTSEIRKLWDKI
ncbi:MAG TPA: carboxylesterase family protein [Draconibacterium sp.]|nr:carboxylesterase family protein [Draconibacterium sp.]